MSQKECLHSPSPWRNTSPVDMNIAWRFRLPKLPSPLSLHWNPLSRVLKKKPVIARYHSFPITKGAFSQKRLGLSIVDSAYNYSLAMSHSTLIYFRLETRLANLSFCDANIPLKDDERHRKMSMQQDKQHANAQIFPFFLDISEYLTYPRDTQEFLACMFSD